MCEMLTDDIGLYVIITNPQLPYQRIAEDCVRLGVKMLQLREKCLTDRQLLEVAKDLRNITCGTQTKLVINDRPDIAALCEADYLHLGQDDIPIVEARKIVGNMGIGLSTHNLQQAQEAFQHNPAYIGFGPIYPTNAKTKPDRPVGVEQLKAVLELSTVPVVAIGGIFPENIDMVLNAGARNVALVRYLMQTENFYEHSLQIIHKLKNYGNSTTIC